jgi:hypothetical protein
MTEPAQPTPSRDDPATMTCPICQTYFTPVGRQPTAAHHVAKPRSGADTKTRPPRSPSPLPAPAGTTPFTNAETAANGSTASNAANPAAASPAASESEASAPHCDQPVALSDLIDQQTTIMPNR